MVNLKRFHPRKELRMFENELFVFNNRNEFSLNEKEEKIWSYVAKTEQQEVNVIFQIILFQKELYISYNSDIYNEELREKSSLIAHRIKEKLNEKFKDRRVVLDEPIIKNFERYNQNIVKENVFKQQEEILALYEKARKTNQTKNHQMDATFKLYGEEGKNLGELFEKMKIADFSPMEDGVHAIKFELEVLSEKEEVRGEFIKGLESLGFLITYEVPFNPNDHVSIADLLESGLLQIEK